MYVPIAGRIANPQNIGGGVPSCGPFPSHVGITIYGSVSRWLIRDNRGPCLPEFPELVPGTQPGRSLVRRSPQSDAVIKCPLENCEDMVGLSTDKKQLLGLVGRKGQTDIQLGQLFQKMS